MKKFCNKISKPDWRITVPNINFKKSSPVPSENDSSSKRSSGAYDFQDAQAEYDKFRSLPTSIYVDSSCESEEEQFEDAKTMSDRNLNSSPNATGEGDIYADVIVCTKYESKNLDTNNSQFEYDVPRISFKFFKPPDDTYENAEIVKQEEEKNNEDDVSQNYDSVKPLLKTELSNRVVSPSKFDSILSLAKSTFSTDDLDAFNNDLAQDVSQDYDTVKPTVKSSVKIVLKQPENEEGNNKIEVTDSKEDTPEKYVSQSEIVFQKLNENDIPVAIIRAGSDPNVVLRRKHDETDKELHSDEDDSIYKIPRSLKAQHRLSQSLHDFNAEEIQPVTSNHTSIEHISCSQIIIQGPELSKDKKDTNAELDYCKTRSKLPSVLRRPTLMRKPKKAMDKWNNFKTKFSKVIEEHASQQRVGAFSEREKVTINFEEMYKNSKDKCRKVFENTGKIFRTPKRQNSSNTTSEVDSNSVNSTPMVKNEEFFKKVELKASDIVYKLNTSENSEDSKDSFSKFSNGDLNSSVNSKSNDDFATLRTAFKRNKSIPEGQNGFEDLRRYVKQGGDFCKELASILQERAEAETQYAKSLSKLSSKLSRACRDGVGGTNEAWKAVALELESRSEGHRIMGAALLEEAAKPLKNMTENQHRLRKQSESAVDKAGKLLNDWRAAEAKSKKQSHCCARENEKLQDAAVLDTSKYGKMTLSRSTSLIQLAHMTSNKTTSDKENAKLEGKKRKAEDAVKKADIEYYTLCVRAERARLEWESAVLRGVNTFQTLEEERLNNLKSVLSSYLQHSLELGPRLIEATERLNFPISQAEPVKDLATLVNLRQSSQQVSEQLLPDFYCEHITLAMNRERRKQALVKLLHLIRQDIERERKSKNGLENLSKAIKQTPNFGAEDSQQSVLEKLYHMKSMLTYLEGARYKVQSALAELDSRPRGGHPLAPHITVTRDKSGLQQSVLKVPQWLKEEYFEAERSPVSEKSAKSAQSDNSDPHINDVDDPEWPDHRGAADGNSNQPDSDFDEFSSQCSSLDEKPPRTEENAVVPIAKCKALYPYSPNLTDELSLKVGDILSVYRQQDDGWWLGECNGNVGIFPATYVEILNTP